MSTISLRLPHSLHNTVRELAVKDNISINQFITLALAEKISALLTETYLVERAQRGDKAKFARAMSRAADVQPAERDRL